jgi:hypothetical protein
LRAAAALGADRNAEDAGEKKGDEEARSHLHIVTGSDTIQRVAQSGDWVIW